MYAVIRAGGRQYRVAPGDVVRMDKLAPAENGQVQFDVLAVSGDPGKLSPGQNAQVTGQVLSEGRGEKILVFHYKRKKQYKKLRGHRQAFSAVRITEIAIDGQRFTAPALPARTPKKPKPAPESGTVEAAAAPAKKKKKTAKVSAKAKSGGSARKSKPAAKSGGKSKGRSKPKK
jgi:large subunit ribosomal protein L21